MRINNSKKNAITSLVSNSLKILIGFIAQKIFILSLGPEYLGLNGLFSNIISMLAIAELGIGSAIIFSLYEPISKNDYVKVKQLTNFYKKTYTIIAMIISIIGIAVIPFLHYFANSSVINNVSILYILFLTDTILSYTIAYKTSLINAYQKNYIINMIHVIYIIIMNALQIVFLLLTSNYLVYLVIKIVSRIIENTMISIQYKKNFNNIMLVDAGNIDSDSKKDIIEKVKALMIHKMAEFFVTGTDNLIISKFLGLVTVGLYSNYYMIINSIQSLFTQMFRSITAVVGNLLTEKNPNKSYYIYSKMLFLNYIIISFCSISLFFLMEPFVSLWIGKEYLLPIESLFVLVIVFYSTGMRNAPSAFKSAGGIFVEDKHVPIIESVVNLFFSIILVLKLGLTGVFIGTLLSSLVLHLYSYPKFVYQKLFNRKSIDYIIEQFKYFVLGALIFTIMLFLSNLINFNTLIFEFIYRMLLCIIVPNLINLLIFYRSDNFKYFIKKFIKKENI